MYGWTLLLQVDVNIDVDIFLEGELDSLSKFDILEYRGVLLMYMLHTSSSTAPIKAVHLLLVDAQNFGHDFVWHGCIFFFMNLTSADQALVKWLFLN
jgi:hypothetical protein